MEIQKIMSNCSSQQGTFLKLRQSQPMSAAAAVAWAQLFDQKQFTTCFENGQKLLYSHNFTIYPEKYEQSLV